MYRSSGRRWQPPPEETEVAWSHRVRPDREELAEIGAFATEEEAHERGLVVLSARAGYWVFWNPRSHCYHLLVEPDKAGAVKPQLKLFEKESANWPPPQPVLPEAKGGTLAALGWAALLVLAFLAQNQWPAVQEAGTLSSEAVFNGQPYRIFTALFLHGDIGHLVGNVAFGGLFLFLAARHVGDLVALAGTFLAGTFGNLANALLHAGVPHYSIGASTAVFGAVGLLVALPAGFWMRHASGRIFRAGIIPLVAGAVFLAWFGTGDATTDTTAHLTGFLCGLPVGLAAGLLRAPRTPV